MNRLFGKGNKKVWAPITGIIYLSLIFVSYAHANDLIIEAKPGQTYSLPATLNDTHIIIRGSGSPDAPFVVTGTNGKTAMNGNSAVLISGDYITVKNLSFLNNNIQYKSNSEALVQFGKKRQEVKGDAVRDCDFNYTTTFDDRDMQTQFFWVEVYGKDNLVDNCTFQGKQNRLPVVHINSNGWTGENNTISNCTFQNVKRRKGDALEAIRVGLGKARSNCKIINNKFINYFGDSETISCKSNGVIIEDNTFTHCRSGVSLRASDSSLIKNNKFSTQNGVRLSGIGHIITDNVFDGPDSSSIVFMKGGDGCIYKSVSNIEISNNVFMNEFELRILQTKGCLAMPGGITMRNNFVYNNNLFKLADDDSKEVFNTVKPSFRDQGYGIGLIRFKMKKLNAAKADDVLKKGDELSGIKAKKLI